MMFDGWKMLFCLRSLRLRSGGDRHGEEGARGRWASNLLFPQKMDRRVNQDMKTPRKGQLRPCFQQYPLLMLFSSRLNVVRGLKRTNQIVSFGRSWHLIGLSTITIPVMIYLARDNSHSLHHLESSIQISWKEWALCEPTIPFAFLD